MAAWVLRSMWLLATIALAMAGLGRWDLRTVRAASPSFCAAYIHPGDHGPALTLFPMEGPEVSISLPAGLSRNLRVNAFSPEGKAVYVQNASRSSDGIRKIEFKPERQSIIPGSVGLGPIWHLTVAQPSGRIFVSGISGSGRKADCGTFEIDLNAATFRTLLAGLYPDCGGGAGDISPDGKRVLRFSGKELSVVDLETGDVRAIKGVGRGLSQEQVTWSRKIVWSPDGRWISAILSHNKIVLIDATNMSQRRNLGASGNGPVEWSPDSKYLLLSKSELRCFEYFESLQTLDVETGRRSTIKSSHCKIGPGWVGWIDPEAVR
jgi:WD40 repeat protein